MIFRVVGGKPGTASAVQLFVAETAKDSLGNNQIQPDSDLTGDQRPKKASTRNRGKISGDLRQDRVFWRNANGSFGKTATPTKNASVRAPVAKLDELQVKRRGKAFLFM